MSTCDNCQTLAINGILTHEQGCPDYWKTVPTKCFDCGCEFQREHKFDKLCTDCEGERISTLHLEA